MNHQADRILDLARSEGVLRTRDVDSAGASRALLASLTAEDDAAILRQAIQATFARRRCLDGRAQRPFVIIEDAVCYG